MTNPDDLFQKILEAISHIDRDDQTRLKTMKLIHANYDSALADALARWMETQDVKIGTVMSTFAFMLGTEFYYNAETESDICLSAEAYTNYIHNVGHAMWRKNGPPKSKKSS